MLAGLRTGGGGGPLRALVTAGLAHRSVPAGSASQRPSQPPVPAPATNSPPPPPPRMSRWSALVLLPPPLKLHHHPSASAGVAVIVETLRTHRSITSLDLSNNPISQLAGRQLLILVQDNRNIVDMKLQNTHLKREFLVKMDGQLQKNRDRCNKKRAQRGG